ncbi:FAD-dependent oxidoreductase [Nonomuraea fuscirosea]|uniref:FAD-dependent oxidoreductase n=1 Tax=Nonomuraea fuscirosea TaxID=1291556 RepID=UPI0037B3A19E
MRVIVDLTRCQGYGQCAYLAPDVFTVRDEALLYDLDPADEQREHILRAAAACPVQAIHLDWTQTRRVGQSSAERPSYEEAPAAKMTDGHIVIVGASLAGARAAGVLRREGFAGTLTVIGDESHEPYDRPPLSKQVLTGQVPSGHTMLPRLREVEAEWIAGTPATGLDVASKRVHLADGREIGFDRVLLATGTRARPWPNEAEAALEGVHTLRTLEDAARMRQALAARPRRVLVLGAGFTGSEIASVCRELDLPVTRAAGCAGPACRTAARWRPTWRSSRSARSATSSGCTARGWPPACGAWPATRAAAPSTPTAWSRTTSSWPATSPASRTRSTSTSS